MLVDSVELSSVGASAAFTLLGVGISACVSTLSIYIKFRLDQISSKEQYRRDVEKQASEIIEARRTNDLAAKRKVFAEFLGQSHALYVEITAAHSQFATHGSVEELFRALRDARSGIAQSALEETRLITADAGCEAASSGLWRHMRASGVPTGKHTAANDLKLWKAKYWDLRRALMLAYRSDLDTTNGHQPSVT